MEIGRVVIVRGRYSHRSIDKRVRRRNRRRLIYSRDEPYQIQLDQLVIEAKHWAPGMGLGEATAYSNYPMLPILAVTAFQLLGLQSGASFFSSILFPALTAILPMFWYVRSAEAITGSSDWALWSGYVFGLNEQFLFFDASFSYESLGIVFFTATMYLLTRRRKGAILSSLMIIGLTLTHFWTNINLVLFLAASYLLPRLGTSLKLRLNTLDAQLLRPRVALPVFSAMVFAVYTSFIAQLQLRRYGPEFIFAILALFTPISRKTPEIMYRSGFELALIIIGQAVLVILGAVAFVSKRGSPSRFLKLIFLLGGMDVVVTLFFLPATVARPLIYRAFFFGFFAIAPVVAWTLHKSSRGWRLKIKALLLVLTIVSIVLIQEPWFIYPDFVADNSEIFVAGWAARECCIR